jgi:hypothetical protein
VTNCNSNSTDSQQRSSKSQLCCCCCFQVGDVGKISVPDKEPAAPEPAAAPKAAPAAAPAAAAAAAAASAAAVAAADQKRKAAMEEAKKKLQQEQVGAVVGRHLLVGPNLVPWCLLELVIPMHLGHEGGYGTYTTRGVGISPRGTRQSWRVWEGSEQVAICVCRSR